MRHLILYVGILVALMVTSCSRSPKRETPPASDTLQLGVSSEESGVERADTVASVATDNADKSVTASQAKPVEDDRSFFQRGYDEGYDAGREDGTMDLGDGYSYCDANPYKGAAKREYERGYKRGYKKGYHEGFYEYSDGDEEIYDEY